MCLVQNMIVFTVLVLGLGTVFSAPTQDGAGHQDGEGHQDLMGAMVRTFLLFNFADKLFKSNVNFVFERREPFFKVYEFVLCPLIQNKYLYFVDSKIKELNNFHKV